MEKVLRLYKYIDGINDIAFPNEKEQAIITSFRYDAKRMGAAPTISFSLMHSLCLDSLWDNKVYASFNGERFYVKQTPTSSYSSSDTRYKHEVELVSERFILDNIYFYDVVSSSSQDKPVSNSSKFSFFGNIKEYVSRLNNSLNKSNVGYSIVIDDDILSDEELMSIESQVTFEDQVITNALQEIYNVYKIPYYFVGKTIHVGYYQDNIDTVFKYGCNNSLISISKTNANSKIINKITGVGSSDNIPYYYPNVDEKGITQVLYNGREGIAEITDLVKYRKVKLADKFVFHETIQSLVPLIDEDDYSFGDFRDEGIDGDGKQRVSIDFYYSFTLQQYESVEFSVTTTYEDSLDLRYEIFNPSGQYVGYYKEDKEMKLTGGNYQFVIRWSFLSKEPMIGSDDVIKNFVSQYLNITANIVVDSSNSWTMNDIPVTLSDYGISVNSPSDGDVLTIERLAYIQPQPNLVPPIYRDTEGNERFYEAINGEYKNEQGYYYKFDNEYTSTNPREHIENFDDIKPTIKNVKNNRGDYIDEFIDFAYDIDDNDETDESGKFIHPYFFGKLRKFDGEFGFNLFDHAIDEGEMVVSMTSGTCSSCEFTIGVDEKSQKNIVQVDANGNLVRDNNGNVRRTVTPQDRQNDTKNNEVWIALKKDIQTFGVVMPNAGNNYRPNAGDKFVLLHIDLPQQYIEAAENALKDKLVKYMYENNFEKFNFSIAFSRIYFAENPTILAKLSENSKIQVEYNKNIYDLYISSLSYSIANDSALPEVKVELEDALSISQNQITQVVESTKREIISSIDKNVFWGDIKGVPTWITSDKPRYSYSELSGRGTSDNSNDVWVVKKDAQGNSYVYTKLDVVVERGVTMYGTDGSVDVLSIFEGLPIDNNTIYWEETKDEEGNVIARILKSRGVGEGGITPTLLGDLTNVGSWANGVASEDRIMVQKKGSSSWESFLLSEIKGSASFENVKESGEGNAFTSFTLSEDKKTLTFVKDKTFAEKATTLLGYGITDAYTKTEADNLLAKKWAQDDAKIANWDTAFGWGDHSKVGYAKATDVTEELKKYVTLSGTQTISGEKNFTGGLKVNGKPLVYDSEGYWLLDGDLIVTGGVTMFANENGYTPSTITDAVSVDNITIIRRDGKLMVNPELVFGGGGGEISTVAWGNVLGKPTWITDTKPEYKYSEIKETPNLDEYAKKGTTLSSYGITDAKIANGVITLGNNTITPLTQVLGDARYVTALGTSGNDLTWTKNGVVNNLTVPYAKHSAHTSYLRNYLGDYSSITDLNEPSTFKTSQYRVVYDFYDGNTANRPVTSNNASGVLTLFKGIHRTGGGQYMSQMAFPDKDAVYFRRASDGVFGDWKLIAFTDSDITGNAGTATALKDRRSLWGQWFDGKGNVSGDMTGVGSVTMDGQLSLNGITIKRSASGVLFIDGNLVVSGGVTMYGTDGTTSTTIWDNAPIANTQGKKGVASYDPNFFAVNNGVVTFVGQTGGGIESITKQMVIDALGYTPYSSANPNGYITGINKSDVTNALGYTPYDASNPNNYVTSSGTVANATNLTSYKAVTLTKSDNGGKPCYLLIADVTSWYSASASSYEWGIAGIMYGWRGGTLSGTCVQKMIAMCSYNKSSYELKSDVITYVKPRIVSYGGKYYIALYMAGSGRSHYFIGKTSRLLDTFIEVACDSNGNCDGLVVVFDTEVMAMGGASVGKLTTKRKIWGQDFDGSSDVSGAITGATTGSFSGNVSMASATINGGKLTYNSTDKYWKLEGDLLVTGGVTMFGSDSSFNPSTITQAVNVDGTTIINDGTKLMLNPNIELGGGGVTDYNDLTGKPDLSVYALKTSLSSYQTKITSTNKLSYSLIEGTPTSLKNPNTLSWNGYSSGSYDGSSKETISIPSNTNQLTNGAGFITSSGSITGNAATATTATKLSTTSKTAWGQIYWTSGGVPTSISGNMSSVGNIECSSGWSYSVGTNSKPFLYLYGNIISGGTSAQLSFMINGTTLAQFDKSANFDVYGGISASDAFKVSNESSYDLSSYIVQIKAHSSAPGIGFAGDSYNWYVQVYNDYMYVGRGTANSLRIDPSGNCLAIGGITMYSDLRKKTILNHVELSLKEVADAPLIEHYYNSDEKKTTHVGSVAQYWAGLNDWFCKEDEEGFLTMEIQNAALASAISVARELTRYESKTDKQIKKLKKRIGELEEEIENLKKV